MRIRFHGHTGARHSVVCNPHRLEYSEKDDKFRILVTGMWRMNTVNMARIRSCELLEEYDPASVNVPKGHLKELTLEASLCTEYTPEQLQKVETTLTLT